MLEENVAVGFPIYWGKLGICPSANAQDAGDAGLIPGVGRSLGVGNGNLLQYSCLNNPMDGGAHRATVQGVAKSWTWLSNRAHTHM